MALGFPDNLFFGISEAMKKKYVYKGKIPKPRKVQKFPELWWNKKYKYLIIQYTEVRSSIYWRKPYRWTSKMAWIKGESMRKERMSWSERFEFISEIRP